MQAVMELADGHKSEAPQATASLQAKWKKKRNLNDNVLTLDPMATQTRHECVDQQTVMVGLAESCPH